MENNLDKLFKSKLEGLEPEYHPTAWDRMEGLLDESGMTPAPKKKSNRWKRFYFFILIFGILFSAIGYYSIGFDTTIGEGSTLVDSGNEKKEVNKSIKVNSNKVAKNDSDPAEDKAQSENLNVSQSSAQTIQKSNLSKQSQTINALNKGSAESEISEMKDLESGQLLSEKIKLNPAVFNSTFNNDQSSANETKDLQNSLVTKKLPAENRNLGIAENASSESNEEAKVIEEKTKEVDQLRDILTEPKSKEYLPNIDRINTSSGTLISPYKLILPQIHRMKFSTFEVGVQASARSNTGLGYSVGPYIAYTIGSGYSLSLGGQFDSQNFEGGPELSVFDKVYSFGSELKERKFSLSNQKSLRMPVSLQKSFNGFKINSGLIFNKVFASQGSISNAGDGTIQEAENVDHEMIHPLTVSIQLGASVDISRYIELDFGMECRPKAFAIDPTTSNNSAKFYPSLGLRYKLFKF